MFSRTERLLLRPGWSEDAAALQAAISDSAVARNLLRVPNPYTLEDANAFLARGWDPTSPRFLVFSRTRGAPRLVGGCGVHQGEPGEAPVLSYWISRPFWGLGFATEAASAVMRIARALGLRRVGASHFVDNPASGRVLAKVGFRPTGRVERRFSIGRGSDVTTILFEDSGTAPEPEDPSMALYHDHAIAA